MAMKTPFILETGPLFIGVIFNWGLLGAFLVQIYIYAVWYHHTDRGLVRYIVYLLFVVESIQTGLMTHTGWEILAYSWGDPTVIFDVPWSSATAPIVGGIVASIEQLYFSWRIWILQKNLLSGTVATFTALCSLMQCVAAITFGGKFVADKLNATLLDTPTYNKLAIVWLAGSVSSDVIIAISLVYIFTAAKQRSVPATGNMLNRLIMQTIQTGVITAVVSCFHVGLYLGYPETYLHLPAVYVVGKLYSNILLANLNNRNRLNPKGVIMSYGISIPDSQTWKVRTGPYQNSGPSSKNSGTRVGMEVAVEVNTIEMGTHSFREGDIEEGQIKKTSL